MSVKFVSDSSCDVHTLPGGDFTTVPLTIQLGEDGHYTDDKNLDVAVMLRAMAAHRGRSYTACPSVHAWMDAFGDADEVYAVAMTSTLSGTYNAARLAREHYLEEHPQAKVKVFDTLTTGPEQRLFIEHLMALKAEGLDFETVCRRAQEYLHHTRLLFSQKSVHNFVQNGRIGKATAAALGILGIRLLATASPKGNIELLAKCRGEKKFLQKLSDELAAAGFAGGKLYISHVQDPSLARSVAVLVQKRWPHSRIKVYPAGGLCSYYAEEGGLLIGFESERPRQNVSIAPILK